jgi:hypothetical protein
VKSKKFSAHRRRGDAGSEGNPNPKSKWKSPQSSKKRAAEGTF